MVFCFLSRELGEDGEVCWAVCVAWAFLYTNPLWDVVSPF